MRSFKVIALVVLCVLGTALLLQAGQNKFGVADSRQIRLDNPMRIGTALLPVGDYKVVHVMEGADHIMVFQQLGAKNPAEARVKCTLVPLTAKADRTEKIYMMNSANERVLQTLVFRGDTAKHVF